MKRMRDGKRKGRSMARWIDGDELIRWIKESQHQTSKMRNVVCKVEAMQGRESKWIRISLLQNEKVHRI